MTEAQPGGNHHEEIRTLLARYCLHLDHDEVEPWLALFTEDAQYHVYGRVFEGHEGIRRIPTGAPKGLHLGGPPVIELIGADRATTRQNLLFVEAGTGILRSVLYDDELVRTTLGWRIAVRRCQFIVTDGLSDRPEQ